MIRWLFLVLAVLGLLTGAASAETVTYIHTDQLGSPVLETNSAGANVRAADYRAYGDELLSGPQLGPAFTGHYRDADTGLVYMQQRYYDPLTGRFLSVDPVGVSPVNGLNFSRYWYASNSPYVNTDPDGRCDGPSTCAIDRDIRAMNSGEMSQQEFMERSEARAGGAAIGLGVIALSRAPAAAPGVLAGMKGVFAKLFSRSPVLTRAQQTATKKIDNIINNNAKPHDFEGVRKELQGIKTGFDHVTEMKNSVKALGGAIKSLQGSLNNPNLTSRQRAAIESTLKRANETFQKMKDTLNGK